MINNKTILLLFCLLIGGCNNYPDCFTIANNWDYYDNCATTLSIPEYSEQPHYKPSTQKLVNGNP